MFRKRISGRPVAICDGDPLRCLHEYRQRRSISHEVHERPGEAVHQLRNHTCSDDGYTRAHTSLLPGHSQAVKVRAGCLSRAEDLSSAKLSSDGIQKSVKEEKEEKITHIDAVIKRLANRAIQTGGKPF